MKIRSITKEEVIAAITDPEKEITDSFGNLIAHKVIKKYLLRVFYRIEEDSKVIITAYKTSKIEKYS
jgi:hypothetical protein